MAPALYFIVSCAVVFGFHPLAFPQQESKAVQAGLEDQIEKLDSENQDLQLWVQKVTQGYGLEDAVRTGVAASTCCGASATLCDCGRAVVVDSTRRS